MENNLIRNDESFWNHSDSKFRNLETQFLFESVKYFFQNTLKSREYVGYKNVASRGSIRTLPLPALLRQHAK